MGKLIYLVTTSLDGYVADENGNFDWAAPSEEVHFFVNDIVRNTGTFLFGRKMYETMKVWDSIATNGGSKATSDFAMIWQAANKVIYSSSLNSVTTANTKIERSFDATTIKKLIVESDKDFGIGGPHLAAQAITADIIDEYHLLIIPVVIGRGNYWLPKDTTRTFDLVNLKKFENGTVHLHYQKNL